MDEFVEGHKWKMIKQLKTKFTLLKYKSLKEFKMKIPGKALSNEDESPPNINTGSKALIIGDV